jgi:hypothetical protein
VKPSSRCGWRRLPPEFCAHRLCRATGSALHVDRSTGLIALTFLALWPIQLSSSSTAKAYWIVEGAPGRLSGVRSSQACRSFRLGEILVPSIEGLKPHACPGNHTLFLTVLWVEVRSGQEDKPGREEIP